MQNEKSMQFSYMQEQSDFLNLPSRVLNGSYADIQNSKAITHPTIKTNRSQQTAARIKSNTVFVPHFQRQEGVVIATKIHGPHQFSLAAQSLCLLQKAYNSRLNYDIIAFTTGPLNDHEVGRLRQLVYPSNLTVVLDSPGLQEQIAAISPRRRELFLQRCKVESPKNLTWWSNCPGRIAYNWQAEFRSIHIWRHPSLAPYKYMMWVDSDAFSTKVWEKDPIAYTVANDLVIFFDHFPQGQAQGWVQYQVMDRMNKSFNKTICSLQLDRRGWLRPTFGSMKDCRRYRMLPLIHGFFHITNLDFYRRDIVMNWQETLIGDCFLCREFDDQIAVTVPAAILAPNRSREMRRSGYKLDVYHNSFLDAQANENVGGFKRYWKDHKQDFPEAWGKCPIKNNF